MPRVFETGTRAPHRLRDGINGFVLADDTLVQGFFHVQEAAGFISAELVTGMPVHMLTTVAISSAVTTGFSCFLLFLPLFLQVLDFLFYLDFLLAFFRGIIILLRRQGSLFFFADAIRQPFGFFQGDGRAPLLNPDSGCRFIDQVDGLIRQEPVRDITRCQVRRRLSASSANGQLMMLFVTLLVRPAGLPGSAPRTVLRPVSAGNAAPGQGRAQYACGNRPG